MQPSLYTCYHQPLNLKFSIHVKTSAFFMFEFRYYRFNEGV